MGWPVNSPVLIKVARQKGVKSKNHMVGDDFIYVYLVYVCQVMQAPFLKRGFPSLV